MPVVLAAGVGAAVLPRALAARDASDRQADAALAAADLPPIVAAPDDAPPSPPAHRARALPAPAPTTIAIDVVAPVATVDGAAAAPTGQAVDTAAVQADVAALLAGNGLAGATDGSTGIPVTVLAAYRKAEMLLAAAKPSCHLPWWVLAGIGKIESDHASGGRVDADGTTRGQILGIALDGSVPGTAVVPDSDGGRWDGDAVYDRAVGPMQFLPGSWGAWGKDGNGDGVADPNNVFDAATAAGYLLCSAGDLSDPATLSRAILLYNHSASYVAAVLKWGTAYRDGATPSPDSVGSVPTTPVQPDTNPPSVTATAPAAAAASPSRPSTSSPPAPVTTAPRTTSPPPTTSPTPTTPTTSATSPPTQTSTSPATTSPTTSPSTSPATTTTSPTTVAGPTTTTTAATTTATTSTTGATAP